MRKALDDRLIVSRNSYTLGVPLLGAIQIELDEPNGEQLHQLARIVLVWPDIERVVWLTVTAHVEVLAHHRMERDLLQQLTEIAEGAAREQIVVVRKS